MNTLEKVTITCIKFYNYTYQRLAYNAGKTSWFKHLPLSARLISFMEQLDEDFLYKLHLCGIEWNILTYEILRLGFPLNLFLNTLKQEYIIQLTIFSEKKKISSLFVEEQCILIAYQNTKKFLGLSGNIATPYSGRLEKFVLNFYLRLNNLPEDLYTFPLGVDSNLRKLWTFFYFKKRFY